jgi:hypothetical protein
MFGTLLGGTNPTPLQHPPLPLAQCVPRLTLRRQDQACNIHPFPARLHAEYQ